MPTRNINLTDHFDAFVASEIESGRYSNASEVLRAGLRMLEQRTQEDQQKLDRLRTLAAEGFAQLDQGLGISVSNEEELTAFMDKIRRAVKERSGKMEHNPEVCGKDL